MHHLIANRTRLPVHLTVRPDPEDPKRRLYTFSLKETPRPSDAIASVWIKPGRYVGIPMDSPTCSFRGENPAGLTFREGTMNGKNVWFIEDLLN